MKSLTAAVQFLRCKKYCMIGARLACSRLSVVEDERKRAREKTRVAFARPQQPRAWNRLGQDHSNGPQCIWIMMDEATKSFDKTKRRR